MNPGGFHGVVVDASTNQEGAEMSRNDMGCGARYFKPRKSVYFTQYL